MKIKIPFALGKILIERQLFSLDLNDIKNIDEWSFPYLIFKWYQALYLYYVLPKYTSKNPVIYRMWQDTKEQLEWFLKKIGKEIYKRAKKIFFEWAELHNVRDLNGMLNKRVEKIKEEFGDDDYNWIYLPQFLRTYFNQDSAFEYYYGKKFYEIILPKVRNIFASCYIKDMLYDRLSSILEDLETIDDEDEKEWLQEEISELKKLYEKSPQKYTYEDLQYLWDMFFEGFRTDDLVDYFKNHCSLNEDILIWAEVLFYIENYLRSRSTNELKIWESKVINIYQLFDKSLSNNIKTLISQIDKIINFTHNNGNLLADHINSYDREFSLREQEEVEQIIGKRLDDIYDVLDYFSTKQYEDPKLVKFLNLRNEKESNK